MSGDLLQTKLFVPRLRPSLVPRPHLIEKLNRGVQQGCKLTLISAPAGFGKTTLLSEWAQNLRLITSSQIVTLKSKIVSQVAWLSLDENDNDTAHFLSYIVATLDRIEGVEIANGVGLLSMIQSPQPPPTETVLTALINEIATFPNSIILVLDDYHIIDASPIDEALTFLLEHLPPQMHLVIATRDDPQLPLARLRARSQLTELRAADLRFSSAEAATFLNQVMGLELAAADIAALEARTEGWIAGLQLAAIALQGPASVPGHRNAASLIDAFTGSHRFVMDYLMEEVLEQQPDNVQRFLLETAVLKRMNSSLCNAVTAQNDSQMILEMLEHANLFIVPLDEERHWYRYHHLFAELLRRQLRQSQQDMLPTLHDRASEWYAQNGFVNDSIEHALHAGDFVRAAHLLKEPIDAIWRRGEHTNLRRWLSEIPLKTVLSDPQLSIFHAWYLFATGQRDLAEKVLQTAEQALDTSEKETTETTQSESDKLRLQGRTAAIRSFMASYRGDVPTIIRQARQALALLPADDLTWRSSTAITLGDAHGFEGDMAAAYAARLAAAQACQAAGNIYFVVIANLKLAITLRAQGKLHATIAMCQKQMRLMHDRGLASTPMAGWCLTVWGETLAELNDLAGARHHAQKGVELNEHGIDLAMRGWSYLCLVRVLFSMGATNEAEVIIQKLADVARESDIPPWIANHMTAWQARLWLEQDNGTAASQWIADRGLGIDVENKRLPQMDYFLLIDYITVARILLAQGRLDETIWLLQKLHKAAKAGGRITKLIEIKLLQALALQAGSNQTQALNALKGAITYAEPEGFIRIFVDEGPPMVRLLHTAAEHRIALDYVNRLLSAMPATTPEQPTLPITQSTFHIPHSTLEESLSEREIEVLQLIAEGLTNPEIANRLYISLNTVKVHTRNIYGKLDAHTRTEAVAKARDLNFLPIQPRK